MQELLRPMGEKERQTRFELSGPSLRESLTSMWNEFDPGGVHATGVRNFRGGEKSTDMTIVKLPLCACGCGRQVKSPGRKLYSRQCIGRYNANAKGTVGSRRSSSSTPVLLERLISLVREVPRESRGSFLAQIVELVNAEEDLQEEEET